MPGFCETDAGDFGNSELSFLQCPAIFDAEQMRALCIEFEPPFVGEKSRLQRVSVQIRCVNSGQALRLGAERRLIMSTVLIVVLVILLLGGFGGYHGYSRYGAPGLGGVLGLVLIVLIVLWLFGGVHA
jgi:Protein of unknown function (DUF3309)